MIIPIEISPLNTSFKLEYECEECGDKGVIILENKIINTDNEGKVEEELNYDCPNCNTKL